MTRELRSSEDVRNFIDSWVMLTHFPPEDRMKRIALIPPGPHLEWAAVSHMHMAIARMLEHPAYDDRYCEFYTNMSSLGDYVILDNGAHASDGGEAMMIDRLVELGTEIGADELVIPDKQRHADDTLTLLAVALTWLQQHGRLDAFTYMFVPQGAATVEWQRCLEEGLEICDSFGLRPVIGIAKHHDEFYRDGIAAMVEDVVSLDRNLTIHLLGWPKRFDSLREVGWEFVRSIDSAKPFVYAKLGMTLNSDNQYIPRDPEYFEDAIEITYMQIVQHNINVFREVAHDGD